MTKLTIAMDERVLARVRSGASQEGTSLDALLRSYVKAYAGGKEDREQAVKNLLDLSRKMDGGSDGRRWTRDEFHER